MGKINIKRIYAAYDPADGFRILVDRLWPRAMKREKAQIDKWMKELAPSSALRIWFDHDPTKWEAFRLCYMEELRHNAAVDVLMCDLKERKYVTLLYGAKDERHNQAVVLKDFLEQRIRET